MCDAAPMKSGLARLVAFMRACLRVAASAKAGGQKTFLLNLYRFNTCLSAGRDTQAAGQANGMGRGVRGLERLFSITSNYITARQEIREDKVI
jgi:hypothetical protein